MSLTHYLVSKHEAMSSSVSLNLALAYRNVARLEITVRTRHDLNIVLRQIDHAYSAHASQPA
jgi:hypothetical protein